MRFPLRGTVAAVSPLCLHPSSGGAYEIPSFAFSSCCRVPRRKYYCVCKQAAIVPVGSRLDFFFIFFFLVITEAGSKRKSESLQRQMLALDGVGGGVETLSGLFIYFTLLLHLFPAQAGCLAPLTLPASRGGRSRLGSSILAQLPPTATLPPRTDEATRARAGRRDATRTENQFAVEAGRAATARVHVRRNSVCQDKDTQRAQRRRRTECLYKWNNSRVEWRDSLNTYIRIRIFFLLF